VTKRKNTFLVDQMIMMSSLNKTVTHEVRFWCYFTEKSQQNPCLKSDTLYWLQVNQSLFFFFTWSFVLSRHFLFVFICIVIVDPIIKKAEGGDPILLYTARYMFVPVPSQELDFTYSKYHMYVWKSMMANI
jgi:hypothetical protein